MGMGTGRVQSGCLPTADTGIPVGADIRGGTYIREHQLWRNQHARDSVRVGLGGRLLYAVGDAGKVDGMPSLIPFCW